MNTSQDKIYSQEFENISDFQFDDNVAGVFNDMIRRSVPGYSQILKTLGALADKYVTTDTYVYDLGCSLGAATLSIRRSIASRNCTIIAVDNSQPMLERCQENLRAYVSDTPVDLVCADIRDIQVENASMVVLNFTLQFLAPNQRLGRDRAR